MGPATKFLKDEASTDAFLQATGESLPTKTMRDREFVNRFVSFYLIPLDRYTRDVDKFLALGLKTLNSTPESVTDVSNAFRRSLRNNFALFGKHAFRKHSEGQKNRGVLNASLWDVMSTGLAPYPEELVTERAHDLRCAFYSLMEDDEFINAVTYSVNGTKHVKTRFEVANAMFKGVLGADGT